MLVTLNIRDFTSAINSNIIFILSGLSDNSRNVYLQKGVFSHVERTSPEICEEGLSAGV